MFDVGLKECFFVLREKRGDKKFMLKHFFRLPTFEDWYQYHKQRSYMGLSKGRDTFEFANVMQEQDLDFWDSLIVRVEGYLSKGSDLMQYDDWKEKIPVTHKLEAIGGFFIFWSDEESAGEAVIAEGFDIDIEEGAELSFIAIQDGNEALLKFKFSQPDTSDYVKFNRIASKLQLVRTKQRNVQEMRMPADIRPFVDMFDKLIVRVDGYVFNGKDLMAKDDWKEKIDSYHKREAVRELFTSSIMEEEGK